MATYLPTYPEACRLAHVSPISPINASICCSPPSYLELGVRFTQEVLNICHTYRNASIAGSKRSALDSVGPIQASVLYPAHIVISVEFQGFRSNISFDLRT